MTQSNLMELDRKGLKAFIKKNKLGIVATKGKSDDDIRNEIDSKLTGTTGKTTEDIAMEEKLNSSKVVFTSIYPKQWIGKFQFANGRLEFDSAEESAIKFIESSHKFGVTIKRLN